MIETEQEDAKLLVELASGVNIDVNLSTLRKRYDPLLRSIISRKLANISDTDDVLQEVWIKILRKCNYDPSRGNATSFLVTAASRRAIDYTRQILARNRATDRFETQVKLNPELHDATDEEAADHELSRTLQDAMNELPESQRQAVELHFFKGMSQRQISAATGIPLGTIKTRLELGMRKLGTLLVPAD